TLRAGFTDLINERTVQLEFEDLRVVAEVRCPRVLAMEVCSLAIAADIHEVILIDVNTVFPRRPYAAVLFATLLVQEPRISRASPGLQKIPCFIEFEHRGSRDTTSGELTVRPRVAQYTDGAAFCVLPRRAKSAGIARNERSGP